MERWNKGLNDFGEQKLGTQLKAQFEFLGNFDDIASWKTSCGCTEAVMNNNLLTVGYTVPSKIPENLSTLGITSAQFRQTIYINYKDGSQDQLHIKGTMVQ